MMAGYTADWRVGPIVDGAYSIDGELIGLALVPLSLDFEESKARANLVAASPKMLEALRRIVACNFDSVPPEALLRAVKVIQDEARTAIAAATEPPA